MIKNTCFPTYVRTLVTDCGIILGYHYVLIQVQDWRSVPPGQWLYNIVLSTVKIFLINSLIHKTMYYEIFCTHFHQKINKIQVNNEKRIFKTCYWPVTIQHKPVSYTHLDVYKRQLTEKSSDLVQMSPWSLSQGGVVYPWN